MHFCLSRLSAVSVVLLTAALTFVSGAGAATQNIKIPAEGFPAANLCNGDQLELQGTLHLVQQGEPVEDAPRQHVVAHLNSQGLTGVGVPSGQLYNVNLITNNIFNARVGRKPIHRQTDASAPKIGANLLVLGAIKSVCSQKFGEPLTASVRRAHHR